ncbi:MAG: glycine--tRNA ligase subunit beta [Acidobacteria bacterium]|nr:MAG: glycine--tRNA ligase subunit beta [Acidobacteriota bacterium]
METAELLVELGTEEIPAPVLEPAARQFADLLAAALRAERLDPGERTVWYTSRRIVVGIRGIPLRQEDRTETVIGPPRGVALDASGAPTRAAQAFAEKNKVPFARTTLVQTPKGVYLALERTVKGLPAARILPELIRGSITKIHFPRTMIWGPDKFRFSRPLRWVVALFRGRLVRFRIAGITSSRITRGHRFLGSSRLVATTLDGLRDVLLRNGVVVDPAERRDRIRQGLAREAEAAAGRLVEDAGLLEVVVNLNEYPTVVLGSFDAGYLALPGEILVTVMREHQKYFSLAGADGALLPHFLAVINSDSDREGLIREGHERVLRARLADAAFFWETDRKKTLLEREPMLDHVLFQEKLGSYRDKTRRIVALARALTELVGEPELRRDLETAAQLAKCDLTTEMVKEFTDLQGIVGGLYARSEGQPESVWRAIYEQYLPKSTVTPSPATRTGALLGLADRLDTVCGCFLAGLVPTGSRDPFAVRRQGNGICKIILDHGLRLSLASLIERGLEVHGVAAAEARKTGAALGEFFEGRLRFLFEERGFSYDSVNAALAVGFDDPVDAAERVAALEEMRREADFLAVASNFKRVKNILAQAGEVSGEPDPAWLSEEAERALWRRYLETRPEVEDARRNHDYRRALRALAALRQRVDGFFDSVLVMAEDAVLRQNRLRLLAELGRLLSSVADISEIVVERPEGTKG